MAVTGTLTMLSGILMYWEIFGFRADALESGQAVALTIGGLAGILALIVGFSFQFRSIRIMKGVTKDIGASGGPPSPEQLAQMGHQAERVALGGRIAVILMTIALIGMATAQYVG